MRIDEEYAKKITSIIDLLNSASAEEVSARNRIQRIWRNTLESANGFRNVSTSYERFYEIKIAELNIYRILDSYNARKTYCMELAFHTLLQISPRSDHPQDVSELNSLKNLIIENYTPLYLLLIALPPTPNQVFEHQLNREIQDSLQFIDDSCGNVITPCQFLPPYFVEDLEKAMEDN